MSKPANYLVTIINDGGAVIFDKKVHYLPLKEALIIAQSIEFFNDPEPCMIHRTAVMKKIFVELIDYFEGLLAQSGSKEIRLKPPEWLRQKLDIGKEEIDYMIVKRC